MVRGIRTVLVVATLGLGLLTPARNVAAASDLPSPATGHAEVIAQGLVELAESSHQWSVTSHPIDGDGITITADGPGFVHVQGGGAVVAGGDDGINALLPAGEAVFRPVGASTNARSLAADGSSVAAVTLSPSVGAGVGEPFTPGAGLHDVELVRDVLAAGETMTLSSPLPAVIVVTAGAAVLADGTALAAGSPVVLAGDIAVSSSGDVPTAVVVGIVSPLLDLAPPASTEPATSDVAPAAESTTSAPAASTPATSPTSPPPTSPTSAPPTPTSPPASSAPTTSPPPTSPPTTPLDTDSDGLSDAQEAGLGTYPNNPDSDADTLLDGVEAGTCHSPLNDDSDGDQITDDIDPC